MFVRRDIKEISLPSNIKTNESFSFDFSLIEEITIPARVTKMREFVFGNWKNLTKS